jgi:hypothetical protein
MSHDDRIRQLTGLFLEDLRLPIETSLQRLLGDLMDIAAQDRTAAVDEALRKAAGDHEAALAAALAAAGQESGHVLEGVRAGLAHEHAGALDALRSELAGHHDEALQALRADLGRTHEEALEAQRLDLAQRHEEALHALRDEAAAEHAAATQDLVRSREESIESIRRQAALDLEAALQGAREELVREHEAALGAVGHDRDAARATIAELTDQLAAARAQHEQLTQLAHAESEAAAETSDDALETRAVERQAVLACTERMVAATRALDGARTLSEILTALVDHASSESIRVAVLLVQSGHLRGFRFAGLGDVPPAGVDLPVDQAGLLGRAVETAAPASTGDAADPHGSLPSFLVAPAGRVGFALPIVVGGRVVAVLYADDAGSEAPVVPSNWPEIAEVLARHAGRCLEVLTLSRAAAVARPFEESHPKAHHAAALETDEAQEEESARRHARLLISEIKLYNEELVERGRREGNLVALLGSEIERARRLYEEKIPAAVRQRVECFDEEIVRTLAGGDRTLLGQAT